MNAQLIGQGMDLSFFGLTDEMSEKTPTYHSLYETESEYWYWYWTFWQRQDVVS